MKYRIFRFILFTLYFFVISIGYCAENPVLFSISKERPALVLTFDDGPSHKYTPRILDILKKYKIKAVFFVLGERAKRYPYILKRIVEEGHELANHSYKHPSFKKISSHKQAHEIELTNRFIMPFQKEIRWFRPPYGSYNEKLLSTLKEKGMQAVMWSIDPRDWKRPSPKKLVQKIVKNMHPGGIILLHDIHATTAQALEDIIQGAFQKGYCFTTLPCVLDTRPVLVCKQKDI